MLLKGLLDKTRALHLACEIVGCQHTSPLSFSSASHVLPPSQTFVADLSPCSTSPY